MCIRDSKNEARDDWTGCTFRVERGPSSEGRAWGMADILTDVARGARRPRPRRLHKVPARRRSRATPKTIGLTSSRRARAAPSPR